MKDADFVFSGSFGSGICYKFPYRPENHILFLIVHHEVMASFKPHQTFITGTKVFHNAPCTCRGSDQVFFGMDNQCRRPYRLESEIDSRNDLGKSV